MLKNIAWGEGSGRSGVLECRCSYRSGGGVEGEWWGSGGRVVGEWWGSGGGVVGKWWGSGGGEAGRSVSSFVGGVGPRVLTGKSIVWIRNAVHGA